MESSNPNLSMGPVPEPVQGPATGTINDMMVCGFNEQHVLSVGHYHKHSQKCRRDRGGVEPLLPGGMKICPFNASHHVHTSVLKKHIEMCDDYYKHCQEFQEDPPTKAEYDAIEKKAKQPAAKKIPRARARRVHQESVTSFDTETTETDAAETDIGETDTVEIDTTEREITSTEADTNESDTAEGDTTIESDTSF